MATLQSPKNRRAEAFNVMINSEWFNYYDLCKTLNNLNVHRTRDFLEEKHKVKFETRFKPFKNRFGRWSRMKEFRLVTPKERAISIYNKINKK
jgi:hypothetical protein